MDKRELNSTGPDFWQAGVNWDFGYTPRKGKEDETADLHALPGFTFLSFSEGTTDALDPRDAFRT
jgi:hypothetical protein